VSIPVAAGEWVGEDRTPLHPDELTWRDLNRIFLDTVGYRDVRSGYRAATSLVIVGGETVVRKDVRFELTKRRRRSSGQYGRYYRIRFSWVGRNDKIKTRSKRVAA
jgi:hypothetical protein